MKPLYKLFGIVILSSLFVTPAFSQFRKANLQASGLTCAMCSRAINNAVAKLSFVESVRTDIASSSFDVVFKLNAKPDIDQLRKAVEDAGFSVAKFKLSGTFNNLDVKNDEHVTINGNTFHFLKVKNQTLNGDHDIFIVDKHFLPSKEFKKYSTATKMQCVQTGKAASCCSKEHIAEQTRIYHVTI